MGYIGILAIRRYLPAVLHYCEVNKINGIANEAILGMRNYFFERKKRKLRF
jgi:hypothetical protein